jgi:propionate CoA-transferase
MGLRERLRVRTLAEVDAILREVEAHLAPIGHRACAIVNDDHFEIAPEVEDACAAMVRGLVERYCDGVSRDTTSGFLRAKPGTALKKRDVAPHVYESPRHTLAHVHDA